MEGLALFALIVCLLAPTVGGVLFSSLEKSIIVSVSPKQGQVLAAGDDKINVSWRLNQSLPAGTDARYKTVVSLQLCYAPVSQKDRGWRKTNNDLKKDKTCQYNITTSASFEYTITRDIPTATYFVRAYVLDSAGVEVAYANLFQISGVSGRHATLDIAAVCFSAFAVLILVIFLVAEKRRS